MVLIICIFLVIFVLSLVFGGFPFLWASRTQLFKFSTYKMLVTDIVDYFKFRKWRTFTNTGIIMYGGLFGTGKTLQMVNLAEKIYKHYDNVVVYSNVTLNNIPFIPFKYLEQLQDSVEDGKVAVYVCDEFGSLFNSRNYKSCELTERDYLTTLNQIRKENKLLIISTQRFGMVDKVFRQVCKEWRECRKFWRFYFYIPYDPWELEMLDMKLVKPLSFPIMTFATNSVYGAYNTKERVIGFGERNINFKSNDTDIVNYSIDDRRVKRRYRH